MISAVRRLRQEDGKVEGSLGCIAIPCLINKHKNKNQTLEPGKQTVRQGKAQATKSDGLSVNTQTQRPQRPVLWKVRTDSRKVVLRPPQVPGGWKSPTLQHKISVKNFDKTDLVSEFMGVPKSPTFTDLGLGHLM